MEAPYHYTPSMDAPYYYIPSMEALYHYTPSMEAPYHYIPSMDAPYHYIPSSYGGSTLSMEAPCLVWRLPIITHRLYTPNMEVP